MTTTATLFNPELGFGMAGMGADVSRIVHSICDRFGSVTYLEIGVGHGGTLAVVADILRLSGKKWRAIGVDLPDGYSLNTREVANNCLKRNIPFSRAELENKPRWERVSLYLADSQTFLRDIWREPTHLALIDGCHGKPCATNDFLNIANRIVSGGIVMFHDFGQDQVGQSQPHCPTGLDVLGACRDLGLLDNARMGWNFNETIIGDKHQGSGDMGVFEKE